MEEIISQVSDLFKENNVETIDHDDIMLSIIISEPSSSVELRQLKKLEQICGGGVYVSHLEEGLLIHAFIEKDPTF